MKGGAKKVAFIVLALLVWAVARVIGRQAGHEVANAVMQTQSPSNNGQIVEAGLKKAAETIRQQAPIRVDADTILTGAVAQGTQITYRLTVDRDIDGGGTSDGQQQLERMVRQNVCGSEKMRSLLDQGVTANYLYSTPSGQNMTVTVSSCT